MQLPKLNFKEDFVFDIKRDKDTFFIYDMVRKSWLVLTPEEWVRQHFVHYFTQVKKFAQSALLLEKKIELKAKSISYNNAFKGNGMYLVVISGAVSINETLLNQRDAMSITDTDSLQITATENAELLLIEVPMH